MKYSSLPEDGCCVLDTIRANMVPKLFFTRVEFKWTDLEQNAFTVINKIADLDLLILYHNCSEELIIDTHGSKMQLRK